MLKDKERFREFTTIQQNNLNKRDSDLIEKDNGKSCLILNLSLVVILNTLPQTKRVFRHSELVSQFLKALSSQTLREGICYLIISGQMLHFQPPMKSLLSNEIEINLSMFYSRM